MLTGLALGAYVGSELACNPRCVDKDHRLQDATLGAGIGMTVVTPLAVHLADSRRGNLAASLAASALLTGFWFLGSALEPSQGLATGLLIVGPPIVQIATSVWIERSTSGRREGEGRLSFRRSYSD